MKAKPSDCVQSAVDPTAVESFFPGIGRNLPLTVASMGGVAFFSWKVLHPRAGAHHYELILSWVGILLLTALSFVSLRLLLWRRPTVTLSSAGICVTLPSHSIGLVAWNEVADVAVMEMRDADIVQLRLKDPDQFVARLAR